MTQANPQTVREGGEAAKNADRLDDTVPRLREILDEALRRQDHGMLVSIAYTAADRGDVDTAIQAARRAAESKGDDEGYEVLANILLRFDRLSEAEGVIQKIDARYPERARLVNLFTLKQANAAHAKGNYGEAERLLLEQRNALDAGGLELLGWTQYRLGKLDAAAQQFAAAYAKKPAPSTAQGLVFSLHRLRRHDTLLEVARAQPGPLDDLLALEVRKAIQAGHKHFSVTSDGQLLLAAAAAAHSTPGITIKPEATTRRKDGVPGEGKLTHTRSGATVIWRGEHDRLRLNVERAHIDDGREEVSGYGFYALWEHTGEQGWGHRLGIGRAATGGVSEGAAASPAWIGEGGVSFYTEEGGFDLGLFRRPVDESRLSLSGKQDTSNPTRRWGRVVETGLRLSGSRTRGQWKMLGALTAAKLTGINVADNTKYELYGRTTHPVSAVPGLHIGPELILSHYQRNLSAYEFGHGGYFSPERFLQLGAYAEYAAQFGKLSLNAEAALGYNWNRQAAAPENPLTGANPGKYPASTGKGVVYRAHVDAAWRLTPRWRIGLTLGTQEGANYSDTRAGIYATGHFD
jgi:hypothetical protein